jgi:8-oxo-dGTP pyrophosphatase MutT (NUDIX family)
LPQFRKVSETEVFRGSLVQVAQSRFVGPDGSEFERDVVHHPGAVVVVPLTDSGTVLMVRQYRAAVEGDLLEIPAGKRDVQGEPTEVTAARELAEEVGRRPGRLDLLARFHNSPGFTDELTWLYLARDLEPVPVDHQSAEERFMTIEEVSLGEVPAMVSRGEIMDAKSIIGLYLTMWSTFGPERPQAPRAS